MPNPLIAISLVTVYASAPIAPPTPPPAPPIASAPRSITCSAFPESVHVALHRGDHGLGALAGNVTYHYDSAAYAACTEGARSIVCDGRWFSGSSAGGTSARLEISLVPEHGAFTARVARPNGASIELGCLLGYDGLRDAT